MADAASRRHYAGKTRLVTVKLSAYKGSAPHPERVEAKNEAGEATVTRVDGDSGHGGADFVDDGVPVTVVGKLTKQEWIKQNNI